MGIGYALGVGIKDAGDYAAAATMKQVEADIEQSRQEALIAVQSDARIKENETNLRTADKIKQEKSAREGGLMKTEMSRLEAERFSDEARLTKYKQEFGMTDDDIEKGSGRAAVIASLKEQGNFDPSEIDKARVRADAASNLGLKDEETHARGILSTAMTEKRADISDARWERTSTETERHNRALEKAALMKVGADKLSPAAKAQLDMASTNMSSALKEEGLAQTALNALMKDPLADKTKIAEAESAVKQARSGLAAAKVYYNEVGKAHLDGWKNIEMPTETKAATAIPQPAIDALLAGKGTDEQFDAEFKEKGAAVRVRAEAAAKKDAPAAPVAKKEPGIISAPSAEYSVIKAGRLSYLEGLATKGQLSKRDSIELAQLQASKLKQQQERQSANDTLIEGLTS